MHDRTIIANKSKKNTKMKKSIVLLAAVFFASFSYAQEYKLTKSTGKIVINLSKATVEGYNGNEILITSSDRRSEDDERAKGLRVINGTGLEDNTGLGVNVADKGNTVEVKQVSRNNNGNITIKVPKGMAVTYNYDKVMDNGKVRLKNIESEIEVSVQYNSVELENVTGPLTIKAVYGSIDAEFGANVKGPLSIVSVYGHVDVTMPTSTKANVSLYAPYGEILAAADFKIEVEKNSSDMVSYKNDQVKGKLNGGGLDLSIKCNYGKIYLRKK